MGKYYMGNNLRKMGNTVRSELPFSITVCLQPHNLQMPNAAQLPNCPRPFHVGVYHGLFLLVVSEGPYLFQAVESVESDLRALTLLFPFFK